tara:strand:- start:827 stop:1081 length:255 start_codon:yes stop_codon:yes gene_type:complete
MNELKFTRYLPFELVYLIADYHNYEKYCKPKHSENLKKVNKDIIDMGEIMKPIIPNIVRQCWGEGKFEEYEEYEEYEDQDWRLV